jgi:prolyl-tRNA synthetase
MGIRAQGDFSDNSMGWKCAQYEMKGVPLRLELGPRDIENQVCVVVRRDNGEKTSVAIEELAAKVPALLEQVQQGLFDKAKKNLEEHIYAAHSIEEAKQLQETKGGFIKTMWCGDEACELKMKEQAGMSSRCIPFRQEKLDEVCACCGKPAKHMIFWGVAY